MHWGVLAISAAHLYMCTYKKNLEDLPANPNPNPRETGERINFNVNNKNLLIRTVYIWISDVFFFKKNVTK
jgi:hypothetical protein